MKKGFEKNEQYNFLTLKLRNELFAVSVHSVREILEVPEIIHVPRAPEYMKGLINVRGSVIPVVDTGVKFGMDPIMIGIDTNVIILEVEIEGEEVVIGALVDHANEVLEIAGEDIGSSPSIGTKYRPEFIEGVFQIESALFLIIDLGKVFSVEERNILQSGSVEE